MPPENRRKGFVVAPEGYRQCWSCGAETEIRVRKLDGHRFIGCREYPICRWTTPLPRHYKGPIYDPARGGPQHRASNEELLEALKRQEERLKNPKLGKIERLRIQDLVEDI